MFFSKQISIRIRPEEYKLLKRIVKVARDDLNLEKYDNDSHFIRAAVIKLLREEAKIYGFNKK